MPRLRLGLLGAGLIGAVVLLVGSAAAPASQSGPSNIPSFKHVFVIMMENTGIEALLGNPNAPWINQAVQTYGVAGNYYGVTHPSQPNYIAATSGSTNGVTADTDTTIDVPNIVDQLESHGKSWKAYMQSYALCNGNALAQSCGNQLYERKHNPFISYLDVQSNPARVAKIVDFSSSRPISRTTLCRTTAGSARTSATTCTAVADGGPPTRATSRTSRT